MYTLLAFPRSAFFDLPVLEKVEARTPELFGPLRALFEQPSAVCEGTVSCSKLQERTHSDLGASNVSSNLCHEKNRKQKTRSRYVGTTSPTQRYISSSCHLTPSLDHQTDRNIA